ncbi:protein GVQW3-like [Watersipora subatra]|uniref:protein GVQW3-like n=1 Tax=Watersipora subatra TaxID=2589382 RepID=UPI00355B5754
MSDSRVKQRCAIKFCVKLRHSATETYSKIQQAYGDTALSRAQVFRWLKAFSDGRNSAKDDIRPGRPSSVHNDANVERIKELVCSDHCLSVKMIAEQLQLNPVTVHQILTVDLEMKKISAKFVPKNLTFKQKEKSRAICSDLLERIDTDPSFFPMLLLGMNHGFLSMILKQNIKVSNGTLQPHLDPKKQE